MKKHKTFNTLSRDSYLRGRPFLIITTYYRPSRQADTSIKGWGADAKNWHTAEQPLVADHVSNTALRSASVIIDITRKTLVKNRYIENEATEIVAHYMSQYRSQVNEAMALWKAKIALMA